MLLQANITCALIHQPLTSVMAAQNNRSENMKRPSKFICRLLIFNFAITLFFPPSTLSIKAQGSRSFAAQPQAEKKKGLHFELSEGESSTKEEPPPATPQVTATPISENETASILSRLPALEAKNTEQEFAFIDRSLPAPRTGKTISESFPATTNTTPPNASTNAPLEIVRVAPDGQVGVAPHLSVTFSQPMVSVTSQNETSSQSVPVKLTPEPKGKWRWVGTKTLLFEPENRFPAATNYTVEIPAGTKSTLGNTLATSSKWMFATLPPKMVRQWPLSNANPRNPIIFVEFDQRIDQAAVLKKIRLTAGKREWKLRKATNEEIQADEITWALISQANKDAMIALSVIADKNSSSTVPLPADTEFTVVIEAGTPSAEGSLKTNAPQRFKFRTHGALRVVKNGCEYEKRCRPFSSFEIQFSNWISEKSFDPKQIRIQPELPGVKTEVQGGALRIEGQSKAFTTYRVTLSSSIRDIYGQTLGKEVVIPFTVGANPPSIFGLRSGFHTLDPYGPRAVSYYSVNHKQLNVSLYEVTPEMWPQFKKQLESKKITPPPFKPFGRLAYKKTINVNRPEQMVETSIDLSPALKDGLGHAVLVIDNDDPKFRGIPDRVWIQSTNIGLDAFMSRYELVGWVNSLKDGKPLANVDLSILSFAKNSPKIANTTLTDAVGLARLPLLNSSLTEASSASTEAVLMAKHGNDIAILPKRASGIWYGWEWQPQREEMRWHVFNDRAMYRPGEEVHIKGWVRNIRFVKDGDVEPIKDSLKTLTFKLKDERNIQIATGEIKLNAFGGFDTSFKLPETINLGGAKLELQIPGNRDEDYRRSHIHTFQVQEFRRPEYEITAQAAKNTIFVGDKTDVTVKAAYYAGGALSNAEVYWDVTSRPTSFTPPGRDDFNFGKHESWRDRTFDIEDRTFSSRTDATGKHQLKIDFISVNPPRPSTVSAFARVTDVNRQSITTTTEMLVHPAAHYVGLRSSRAFVEQGQPLIVQSIVTDLDGKAIANREIKIRAVLLDWNYQDGKWHEQETEAQEQIIKSASDAVACRFETKHGGQYRITATIADDQGRPNESEMLMWVAGGKIAPRYDLDLDEVKLISDRKEYQDDDTAEILVQAPFYPAEGVMTLRRSGIVQVERFTMNSSSYTLRVPIKDAFVPNLHVQVDLVGATVRNNSEGKPDKTLPTVSAFASGTVELSIPPLKRKLQVTAIPRSNNLKPGDETDIDVEVKDASGKLVSGSEVTVVVVDEAILALTNYKLSNPINSFYANRDSEMADLHSREQMIWATPTMLQPNSKQMPLLLPTPPPRRVLGMSVSSIDAYAFVSGPRAKGGGGGIAGLAVPGRLAEMDGSGLTSFADRIIGNSFVLMNQFRTRSNFNPLATFAASLITDSNGHASVKFELPDNLTRYRVMAVAAAGKNQFGAGESAITAKLPLMVRPSAPRFLNFGDRFELPVVVQNQTDKPMTVDLAVRATNASLTGAAGKRVAVPANDRVEVRFPATTINPGTAQFQIAAVAGEYKDAAEVTLPVWTPATTEAFATYGEVDAGAISQPVKAPVDAVTQFGGLEITTSSTQLQALTDAVLYLSQYPFECAEQISSRVLAVAALRDVLNAFKADGLPAPEQLQQAVSRDLGKLQSMQNGDGGFGFWRRGERSWPFLSIHAAHAMLRAKEKQFAVSEETLNKSKEYLRRIEKHLPSEYNIEARRALIAYALYVRSLMGERDTVRARRLVNEAGANNLSLEAAGWLLAVLSKDANSRAEIAALRRQINNRAEETAGTAHFTTSYKDGEHLLLASEHRTDAVILDALIADQPQSDLISKLVRGLLAHRKQGRWANTQENAFALLALDRYFRTYEKTAPDFVARVWLNEAAANAQEFKGRTTDRRELIVPMKYLAEQSTESNLILSKEGTGRLYYRIGMKYAPREVWMKAADNGFTVERSYEAIDNPHDVGRDEDGAWRIKAGARVRVKLTMIAPVRRYHIALVDALPAGFESLNPALSVTDNIPADTRETEDKNLWRRSWRWFEHQNLRDERTEVFASFLREGVYNYSYIARATTPGVFIAPPAKAEEMYSPETFGRSATSRVIIE